MDSRGAAEAVVTVSERVAPRGAAGNRTVDGTRWAMVSGFPRCGRLLDRMCAPASPSGDVAPGTAHVMRSTTAAGPPAAASRSDVTRRDDLLADRHDAIYRGGSLPRVREVA
jgi:hypothetical protein